jgi:predicted enzyme related to lactoylglutathione lyase
LFGWERTAAHDMGPMGFYYLFGHNGRDIGGVFDKPAEMPGPPAWLGYVRGKDLDSMVDKAKAGGGTLVNGPMEVPGGDWIAQFVDPQGATFAVHVIKADVEAVKSAKASAPADVVPLKTVAKVGKTATNKSTPAAKKSTPARKKSTATKKKAASTKKRTAKAKSVKRSARKAGTVRRSQKVHKAKAASRKKSGAKKKAARPKKGK